MGLAKYIKKAFLFHWNLLAFAGGAAGFALISGHPACSPPLRSWPPRPGNTLGFIGTSSPIPETVDAQENKAARTQASADAVERLMRRVLSRAASPLSGSERRAACRCVRSPSNCAKPTA